MFLSRSSSRFFRPLLLAVSLALGVGASAQQMQPPRIQPDSGPWNSGAGFQFDLSKKKIQKTRQSVSGMACNIDARQRRICLIAFDEGAEARYAYLGDQASAPDAEPVVLRDTDEELDAEAAATDGRYFYVTGSHSAKRSDCTSNAGSRHVLRFRLDPATGRALRRPAGSANGTLVITPTPAGCGKSCRRSPAWQRMSARANAWVPNHRTRHQPWLASRA